MALTLICALAITSGVTRAHIVYGTPSLRQLTLDADLVVRARIVDPGAELVLEDPLLREAVVVADVLEPAKGTFAEPRVRFVQHGHGVPIYRKGEEVLLFLQLIERSRELGRGPVAEHVRWISVQEAGARFPLEDDTRAGRVAAVRAYARIGTLAPEARAGALRRITVELLASSDRALSSSALRDVVLAAGVPILSAADLPQLESVLANPKAPIGVRIGLLVELERRALVEGPPRWAQLLHTSRGSDRFAVVRAVAAHPSPAISRELRKLLASDDRQLVAAVAVSLGTRGNTSAVKPLAGLLSADDPGVRMAAIRGLGRIGTPNARKVLAKAAQSHADPATRRRAGAEVRLLRGEAGS